MGYLIAEIALYLAVTFGLTLLLGYAIWGWGSSSELEQERAKFDRALADARRMNHKDAAAFTSAQSRIDKLEAELADAGQVREAYDAEIAALRQKLTDTASTDDAGRSPPRIAAPEIPVASHGITAPTNLYTVAPPEPDDLKEIKGVGPVMESILNKLGIYHYRQLAAFNRRDVEWVSAEIDTFPDRILRDRWVEQSGELHYAKYGRPYDA